MSSKLSKSRVASAVTAARLSKVITQVGNDALQPAPTVLATAWAKQVNAASRVQVIAALKAASPGGSPGFDYGPVGLTLLRWITVNRLLRCRDAQQVWTNTLAGVPLANQPVVPAAPPSRRKPVAAAPVLPATPVAPAPVAQPVAAPAAPAAPLPVFPEVVVEDIVAEAVATLPPDIVLGKGYVSPAEAAHPEWNWQPASKVFGIKTLRGNVAVWPRHGEEGADLNVKRVDAGHIWDEEHLQWVIFCAGEYSATGAWFHGNRGAGKTEFATQFAAATGRPFYKVTFTRTMEPSEFLGDTGAAGGDSVWQDGRILMGLRNPIPSVFLLDEISYGQSSHISGPINEIVHPDCSYTIPKTGEVVNFSKSHLFIAADNTNGTGDVSGMYEGVNNVNRATMDRFSYFRRFTYLPPALEQKMIQNRALCSPAIATKVWSLLDALRKKVDSGELKDPPSVREATAMAKALRSGLFTDADAFESSFVGKYPEDVQEDVRVTFVATFKQA